MKDEQRVHARPRAHVVEDRVQFRLRASGAAHADGQGRRGRMPGRVAAGVAGSPRSDSAPASAAPVPKNPELDKFFGGSCREVSRVGV